MLALLQSVPWENVARLWGPLGIIFLIAVLGTVAGARMVKGMILGTIEDARKERNYMREQREREATAFIQSLNKRDEMMKDGFDEVLREIRDRRK